MKNPQSDLVELFLKSIRNIIHGNHVDGAELQLKESKVIPFDLRVSIYWDFQAHWQDEEIAGGNRASINHGQSKGSFDQQHSTFINDTKYNTENRYQFLNPQQSKQKNMEFLIKSLLFNIYFTSNSIF